MALGRCRVTFGENAILLTAQIVLGGWLTIEEDWERAPSIQNDRDWCGAKAGILADIAGRLYMAEKANLN